MLLAVLLTGMVLVQGCKEEKPYMYAKETDEQAEARRAIDKAKIAKRSEMPRAQEQPEVDVDDYARIRIFLIQHPEFGLFSHATFIGDLPANGKGYSVILTNGRDLTFFFRDNEIMAVGEEVPGGFIVHYGRI